VIHNVAQSGTLSYPRISLCRSFNPTMAFRITRPCRLQIGDTAECNSALRFSVAATFNHARLSKDSLKVGEVGARLCRPRPAAEANETTFILIAKEPTEFSNRTRERRAHSLLPTCCDWSGTTQSRSVKIPNRSISTELGSLSDGNDPEWPDRSYKPASRVHNC
jgi:hypothetical protein